MNVGIRPCITTATPDRSRGDATQDGTEDNEKGLRVRVLSEGGRWAAVFRQCLGRTAKPGATLHKFITKLRVQGGSGLRVL